MTKHSEILHLKKKIFFDKNYKSFILRPPMEGFQAEGEAPSPLKRSPVTSKHEIFSLFLSHFCPYSDSQSYYGFTDSTGSGSETLFI